MHCHPEARAFCGLKDLCTQAAERNLLLSAQNLVKTLNLTYFPVTHCCH